MSLGDNVKRLRELVAMECNALLRQCRTRDECMDLGGDLRQLSRMVERYADDDCYDRAIECDSEAGV